MTQNHNIDFNKDKFRGMVEFPPKEGSLPEYWKGRIWVVSGDWQVPVPLFGITIKHGFSYIIYLPVYEYLANTQTKILYFI